MVVELRKLPRSGALRKYRTIWILTVPSLQT